MHISQLSRERKNAMIQSFREDASPHVRALSEVASSKAILHACGDRELEQDMIGNHIGFCFGLIVATVCEKHPYLVDHPDKIQNAIENWIDAIGRGIMASQDPCHCPACQQERL